MSMPKIALKYSAIVMTIVSLLMGWGLLSYSTMPRREDPEYTVRTCCVYTQWPGVPAEKVEELITEKLEKAIDTIDDVRVVYSTTSVGRSTIYVDAEKSVGPEAIDNVWDKVRARVARVQMPEPNIVPYVNDEFGDTNVMLMAVYQTPLPGKDKIDEDNRYTLRELDIISERVKDAIKLIPGVAKAQQIGVREEAIYIETDLGTWTQLALTTSELQQLVAARNIVAPGGNIDTSVGRFSVKPGGELNAVRELDSVIVGGVEDVKGSGYVPVHLKDVGLKIVRDYEDPPSAIARYGDGETSEPCIIVAFTMKDGANVIEINAAVKARIAAMKEVEKTIPPDIGIAYVSDQAETVTKKLSDFVVNVVEAILIVIAVVYLMVGFRSAAVMAANIPVVVLATFALIPLFGVQLEQISLASLIIALGLLVDNAVQVCDQCRALQMQGMSPREAAIKGTSELAFPILIATGTTIAAFLPMLIGLSGSSREYVYSLPVTLSICLGISYVLAMTLCTLLASWFIRPPKDPSKPSSPVLATFVLLKKLVTGGRGATPDASAPRADRAGELFVKLARPCVKGKYLTIAVSFALLVGAFMLPVGTEFFPQDLRDQFAVEVWLPEGGTIRQTDAVAANVENILRRLSPTTDEEGNPVQRIRAMRTIVGSGGARWYMGRNPEATQPSYAEILVRTSDPRYTHYMATRLRSIAERGDDELGFQPIVGARIIPRELLLGPPIEAPIGLRIYGQGFADMATLRSFAERLKDIIRAYPGTWDVHDVWGSSGYQLHVDIDTDRANMAGVTNLHVAQTLNAYFSGQYLTTFREHDHLVPVYLRLPAEQRGSLDELRSAYVEGAAGKVPLDAVASFGPRWQPAKTARRKLNRMIEVRARVEQGVLPNVIVQAVLASPEMQKLRDDLPPGYWIEVGGMLKESLEGNEEMGVCLSISLVSIILLLVIQYNGWAKPIIILTTLPLALIGAFLGLYVTDNSLGFMPQLGILSLFGIVLNTAIIYIEVAEKVLKEKSEASDGSGPIAGLTRDEFIDCLVDAGRQRLLPIALTTLTTIGGLIPLAFFGGPLWEGMAFVMIFGLLLATLLTLIVVPALYAVFTERLRMQPFPSKD